MAKKRQEKKQRISPQEAAAAASRYYNALTGLGQAATVEEMELNDDGTRWLVTLGLVDSPFGFAAKTYKVFDVDAYTGEVLSMKIRQI